jgi:aminoglycoside 3-N-acetyltransferase I
MSDPAVSIRHLAATDVPVMRALNALFSRVFDDPESYEAAPPGDDWLSAQLGKEHVIVLTAVAGDAVIGGLVAYELPKLEQARREIYIYDLAVDEAHQRKGIATALIEVLRAMARERAAWVIYVQADYGDDPAIALYTRLGTREDVMHYDIMP